MVKHWLIGLAAAMAAGSASGQNQPTTQPTDDQNGRGGFYIDERGKRVMSDEPVAVPWLANDKQAALRARDVGQGAKQPTPDSLLPWNTDTGANRFNPQASGGGAIQAGARVGPTTQRTNTGTGTGVTNQNSTVQPSNRRDNQGIISAPGTAAPSAPSSEVITAPTVGGPSAPSGAIQGAAGNDQTPAANVPPTDASEVPLKNGTNPPSVPVGNRPGPIEATPFGGSRSGATGAGSAGGTTGGGGGGATGGGASGGAGGR